MSPRSLLTFLVGSERAARMLKDEQPSFLFC